MLGLACFGMYGVDKWEQNFLQSDLYSSNSPEREFFKLDETLFPNGSTPIEFIVRKVDYTSPQIGSLLLSLEHNIRTTPYVEPHSFYSWYAEFLEFLLQQPTYNATLVDGIFPPADKFYSYLDAFLSTDRGRYFLADLVFEGKGSKQYIFASRFSPLGLNIDELSEQVHPRLLIS